MLYTYKGKRPITYAEEFIDAYVSDVPAAELPPRGCFTYHQGVFLSGVEQIYLQNTRGEYANYIDDWLSVVLNPDKTAKRTKGHFWLSPESLDFRQPINLLFRKYCETRDKDYLNSIAELTESLKDFPKNSYGGLWHMKSQPNQMWLDGLYMAGPLCARYASVSSKREFGELALRQAVVMYENMNDPKDGLLFHGWDDSKTAEWADKTTGLSSEKWGRALGWFTVASLDIIESLEDDYADIDCVKENLHKILYSLLKVQRNDGFWCQVISKPWEKENWKETSATCLIACAMAKAFRLEIMGEEAADSAKLAFEGVIDSLQQGEHGEPILGGICVGTCIDEGTYEHYINRATCANDLHGSGAYLLMCAELNRI